MLRRTLVAITVLIAMNISLYTITVWIPTIFVNSGIDVTKSILMTAIIMIGAPVGIFIAALIIDRFPRRLFGSSLLMIIAVLGYVYSIQTAEWAILSYGLVMIFFLYMYVCFASAVYVPELWPTHLRLRGSGFVNAVGRIVAVFTPYGVALLLTRYGAITVFMVLGVMLVLCALILFCFGIETRKVSLEEISAMLRLRYETRARARMRRPRRILRVGFQPVVQGIQRCARGGHLHKRQIAILRLNIHPAAAVGNHVDGIAQIEGVKHGKLDAVVGGEPQHR
jgi:MFS family permease